MSAPLIQQGSDNLLRSSLEEQIIGISTGPGNKEKPYRKLTTSIGTGTGMDIGRLKKSFLEGKIIGIGTSTGTGTREKTIFKTQPHKS